MDLEQYVKIKSVNTNFQPRKHLNKYLHIARVCVTYYNLTIQGHLVRGNKPNGEHFYFFEIPCYMAKGAKGKYPIHLVRFDTQSDSDLFQLVVLRQIEQLHPEFFEVGYGKTKIDA